MGVHWSDHDLVFATRTGAPWTRLTSGGTQPFGDVGHCPRIGGSPATSVTAVVHGGRSPVRMSPGHSG